ncbi:ANTAR domain-containing protein, partial [Bacillus sp. SIMBA_026]|uniref:ANTAR domain-containing protein n=1 Tax=Bacillus sp. SIMBA_026 TaxID=3085769 RepID=UPI0039781590
GVYGPEEVALLELFASPAATLLAHIQTSGTVERISTELQAALDSRDVVNQARGILIERHGLTPDRALHHLLRIARDSKSTLQAVSVDL